MHLGTLLAQVDAGNGADSAQIIVGIISIALGVLILIVPRILNYVVAAYLVVIGIVWLVAGF